MSCDMFEGRGELIVATIQHKINDLYHMHNTVVLMPKCCIYALALHVLLCICTVARALFAEFSHMIAKPPEAACRALYWTLDIPLALVSIR